MLARQSEEMATVLHEVGAVPRKKDEDNRDTSSRRGGCVGLSLSDKTWLDQVVLSCCGVVSLPGVEIRRVKTIAVSTTCENGATARRSQVSRDPRLTARPACVWVVFRSLDENTPDRYAHGSGEIESKYLVHSAQKMM